MSRQELERLVGDAEASASIREQLERCRSRDELVLMARRLGYRLTGKDLQRAWWEDNLERRAGRDADAQSPVERIRHQL
ncbi:MAG: Nif11-like leader peptide family natural product precursor [Prochlorococcaceae cyanobacterium]